MSKIKNIVASMVCSDFVGRILSKVYDDRIPSRRYGNFIYDCSSEYILNEVKAEIFWGIYESAEVRFVRQYLRSDLDVIELGASIGVVSTQILRSIKRGNKFITIEANPYLLKTLKSNLEINNIDKGYEVLNKAISYDGEDEIRLFLERENVHSSINKHSGEFVKVKSVKLSDILEVYKINSYALVSDIEGTEIEFILNESDNLSKCEQLFIELHDTEHKGSKYKVKDIVNLLNQSFGFKTINRYGTVFYFERE